MNQSNTFNDWLLWAADKLKNASTTPRLDSEVLLSKVTNKTKAKIYAYPETVLTDSQKSTLNIFLKKRLTSEPIAYITEICEFYGRYFKVNKNTLIPRPESEDIIDIFKEINCEKIQKIADIGTGSGALGITIKLESPSTEVFLSDISQEALNIAKINSVNLKAPINLHKADLLEPNYGPYDLLICNLPYVPDYFKINKDASHEPAMAIFGGEDGLFFYRRLINQLSNYPWRPKFILTESMINQHDNLCKIFLDNNYHEVKRKGLVQLFTFN